jgi:hypothetical protein
MGAVTGALVIIGTCIGIAVLGLWLSRRHVQAFLPRQNDLSAAVFGVIGTLYGVLLALLTITVLERHATVEGLIAQEASQVWDLHRDVAGFPPGIAETLQEDLRQYVDSVIHAEWPAMRQKRDSDVTDAIIGRFMQHLVHAEPRRGAESALQLVTLQRTDDFLEKRRERLFMGRAHLDTLMWVVLVVGAIVTIGCSYAFWAESLQTHAILTGALAAVIGLSLYLIARLDHPLWGTSQSLRPTDFEQIRDRMGTPALGPEGPTGYP